MKEEEEGVAFSGPSFLAGDDLPRKWAASVLAGAKPLKHRSGVCIVAGCCATVAARGVTAADRVESCAVACSHASDDSLAATQAPLTHRTQVHLAVQNELSGAAWMCEWHCAELHKYSARLRGDRNDNAACKRAHLREESSAVLQA